jgi:hypothetical protein
MPKSWAKPFITILKANCEGWVNATDKVQRKQIIKVVADAVTEQVTAGGDMDDLPDGLDDVRVLFTCQSSLFAICLTPYRKFGTGLAIILPKRT